jgi:5-methylcytosine-specific restriction enzyme A
VPLAAPRPCSHPGCGRLTDGATYCPVHTARREQQREAARQEYDKKRGTSAERGYDGRWQEIRKHKLSSHPICERCLRDGRVNAKDLMVHHKDRNRTNNSTANLETICRAHHEQEHKNERWGK